MGNCSSTKNKKKSSTTNRQPVNLAPTIQNNKPTNTISKTQYKPKLKTFLLKVIIKE